MMESVVWFFTGGRLFGFDGESGATLYAGMDSIGTIDKYQTPIVAMIDDRPTTSTSIIRSRPSCVSLSETFRPTPALTTSSMTSRYSRVA